METVTESYVAFVDVPNGEWGGYVRYYVEKREPNGISGSILRAKQYARKKDAENAAKWMRDNIRPRWYNGLDFTAKGKKCGILYKKIVETQEETIL